MPVDDGTGRGPVPGRLFAVSPGVVRASTALREGRLTRGQLRTTAWRRLLPDVYADATLPVTHPLLAHAVALVAPPSAAFGGRTAAVLWGARDLAGPDDPVEVVLPPGVRWRSESPRVTCRTARLDDDVVANGTLRWTARTRTALDLARRGPLDDAVVVVDQLVRAEVVDLTPLREAANALPRCRGSAIARRATALADGLAESPQETRTRLLVGRAGFPPPVAQHRVLDADGRFVARVDFAWIEQRLALEYDGYWHGDRSQVTYDRRRLNRLLGAEWRVIFVTAADLREPAELLARIAAELAR